MAKLKIKLHENNEAQVDRYAVGTKQYLVPRIITALNNMRDSGELKGDVQNARYHRQIANKLKRNPEIADALDWWLDALVAVYLKEDLSNV